VDVTGDESSSAFTLTLAVANLWSLVKLPISKRGPPRMSLLYSPPDPHSSATFRFLELVNAKFSESLESYEDLYHWSIAHISDFWRLVWDWTSPETIGVCSPPNEPVVDEGKSPQDNPAWFTGAQLNFAENLLWCRSKDKIALTQLSGFPVFFVHSFHLTPEAEPTPQYPALSHRHISYAQLYDLVGNIVSALLQCGLQPGERVASYSSNCIVSIRFDVDVPFD
jgi:acetoacetyl-CoA synthetase